jgi:hydroxymethylglutaryl-CoA lyase
MITVQKPMQSDGTAKTIVIREMGVRDGLQNEKQIVSTQDKLKMIQLLIEAGVTYIEATAFVSAKAIPQMSDAVQVAKHLPKNPNVTFSALVPNEKGFETAIASYPFPEIAVFTAASETFNQKNINTTIAGSFERFAPVMKKALDKNIRVRGYVSTAFYCPYEGKISPAQVMPVIERLFDMGCYEVSIGDTIGKATPKDIDALFKLIDEKQWISKVAGHYHDTYQMALKNVEATMKWGVTVFDTSVGGIGGCPYAPGASGNLATDDLVLHLDNQGIDAGIDLAKLLKVSTFLQKIISHPR